MIDPLHLVGLAGAPLVIALVQLVRVSYPEVPTRYLPALTLLVAVALNLALALMLDTPIALAVLVGVITGLTASGIYSQATTGLALRAPSPTAPAAANGVLGPGVPRG